MEQHALGHDRTALVVDDDVFVASALAEFLEEDGYDVHTASNGFSGLRRAIELRPAVILLDLALPERSGSDLLHDLRSDPGTRDLAVVLVSGHLDELTESQLAEADGAIAKPWDELELRQTLVRAAQRAAPRRAEVAPVAAVSHREVAARTRRATSARRTRGRR